jgi:flagellar basal-body rod protein FlgB
MDFSKLQLFSMMKQRMAYGSERQSVLAQNIANANTPGYRAKDIAPPNFSEMAHLEASKLPMAVTNPGHIAFHGQENRFAAKESKSTHEEKPDKNNVVLEEQMMKMQSNNVDYQTTTSLYRRMVEMFNTSIGNP